MIGAATNTSSPPRGSALTLLEPLGQAVAVAGQPGALLVGAAGGAAVGALLALAASLAFVRSAAAFVAGPLALAGVLVIWALVVGAVALASTRQADGASGRIGPALGAAWRRLPALAAMALPIVALLGALVVLEVAAFLAMGAPENVVQIDRPIAAIAVVYTLLLLVNAAAIALASVTLWVVTPYVMVDGAGPAAAYARAHASFWQQPAWSLGVLAVTLALASAVAGALTAVVVVALAVASAAQLVGANELILLRFSQPLFQESFIIQLGDLAAVVIVATGIGAAIGAAVGFGSMFGVAGGAGWKRALALTGGRSGR